MNSRRLIVIPVRTTLVPEQTAYLDGQSRARPLELAGNEPLPLSTRAALSAGNGFQKLGVKPPMHCIVNVTTALRALPSAGQLMLIHDLHDFLDRQEQEIRRRERAQKRGAISI
jgi:hypothetical protein